MQTVMFHSVLSSTVSTGQFNTYTGFLSMMPLQQITDLIISSGLFPESMWSHTHKEHPLSLVITQNSLTTNPLTRKSFLALELQLLMKFSTLMEFLGH
jgi:hypothetical protein